MSLRFRPVRVVLVMLCMLALALPVAARSAPGEGNPGTTERISVSSASEPGNENSFFPAISADGRYVVFTSHASNLVAGDTNGVADIFLRDRLQGVTRRVSIASNGDQALGPSDRADISGDGRFIAFHSEADNLVSNDTNGYADIFVHDQLTGITDRVSVSANSEQGNGDSWNPAISGDGRYVAFTSYASNLDDKDTNQEPDVFLRDRQLSVTTRISVSSRNNQGNRGSFALDISEDGRYVVFSSLAWNLVEADNNRFFDIFVYDGQAKTVERVSVSSSGEEANGDSYAYPASISADGRYVVFGSDATNLVTGDANNAGDVFIRDRLSGTTELVSVSTTGEQANAASEYFGLSADGRFVVFGSPATNLVEGEGNGASDVFLHDRQSGRTELVSVSPTGVQGNGASDFPAISSSGQFVVYSSKATNLASGDTGGYQDIFVRGWLSQSQPRQYLFLPLVNYLKQ